jgi:hypothetical protein
MSYRPYAPPSPLLIGYDPVCDLPPDHLARLVEAVVEEAVAVPPHPPAPGNAPFDPRLPIQVLVYGYATGTRSSRRLEQFCTESLPYPFLTRGDTPSYRTLCRTRVEQCDWIEQVWIRLFAVAGRCGLKRVGQIVVDSSKLRADASPEAVLTEDDYAAVRAALEQILEEARQVDEHEEQEGPRGTTRLGAPVEGEQMREILRRVRKQLAPVKRAAAAATKEAAAQKKGAERAAKAAQPPRAGGKSESVAAPEAAAAAPAAPAAVAAAGGTPPAATGEGERGLPAGDEAAAARTVSGASRLAPPPPDAAEPAPSAVPIAARPPLTRRMRARVEAAVAALDAAMAEGRKHLCLTDPDARRMGEGRSRRVQEGYSFEVAVDRAAGLLVAASVTQEATDNARLEPLVEQANAHEPEGVKAADGDSGYFRGGPWGG